MFGQKSIENGHFHKQSFSNLNYPFQGGLLSSPQSLYNLNHQFNSSLYFQRNGLNICFSYKLVKFYLNIIRKLKAKLKTIVREPSLIENILKSFTTDEIYKVDKYFEVIKAKFLKIYGYNNKDLSEHILIEE